MHFLILLCCHGLLYCKFYPNHIKKCQSKYFGVVEENGGRLVVTKHSRFYFFFIKFAENWLTYQVRIKTPTLLFWSGGGGMLGWFRSGEMLPIQISFYLSSNLPKIDLHVKFHQNQMKNAQVSILGWWGWYKGVVEGWLNAPNPDFLTFFLKFAKYWLTYQISSKLDEKWQS